MKIDSFNKDQNSTFKGHIKEDYYHSKQCEIFFQQKKLIRFFQEVICRKPF